MALLFPKKQRTVLGVDLGATAVNIVELGRSDAGLSLKCFASVSITREVMSAHTIQDAAALSTALKLALTEAEASTAYAAIALPAALVITKTLSVDAGLGDEELEAYMQLEAADSIPYPLEEVYRDFCVLRTAEKDPTKVTVLLVAARKQVVDSRIQVLQEAGLKLTCVEVNSFVLERMLNYLNGMQPMGKTLAVVELSRNLVTFSVVHNGYAIYSREEPGVSLTGIEIDSFITLLRRFIQLFLSSGHPHNIDKIFFTVAEDYLKGLYERVREDFSMPCALMTPFQNMLLSSPIPHDTSSFAIACGLALRQYDDRN